MKKITFLISILFVMLTFLGAIYVLYHNGKVSPGYAAVPMVFALVSISFFRHFR